MNPNRCLKISLLFCLVYFRSTTGLAQWVKAYSCERIETDACFEDKNGTWEEYVKINVNPMTPVLHCAPAGTYCVKVRFLVQKDGRLVDIKPLTKVGYGMEEEVMRVVRQAPNWIPATQNGKKCRAYKSAAYVFELKNPEGSFL